MIHWSDGMAAVTGAISIVSAHVETRCAIGQVADNIAIRFRAAPIGVRPDPLAVLHNAVRWTEMGHRRRGGAGGGAVNPCAGGRPRPLVRGRFTVSARRRRRRPAIRGSSAGHSELGAGRFTGWAESAASQSRRTMTHPFSRTKEGARLAGTGIDYTGAAQQNKPRRAGNEVQ